ncbi:pyridoxal-phosphate dependent enzyme [[Mycobacterium] burgundiense]|uniref:Pyridoxal-phosphate dependent enzyme n=1 Tax=[Mycobacterium] burgundiense TaxID=3064286 RepID=A0ABM9LR60_9MYCO|nr:pyridoxal-phosphate dependent enzyme [Mycolicibacterium sp. MU0053]CAJ1503306.1 pyridoxal-phosphate dependent enzyme [Mycolicibacterium sp. MU0053]
MTLPDLLCGACGARYGVATLAWRCGCGGVLDVARNESTLHLDTAARHRNSLWRYESVLPVGYDAAVSLGEGCSPLVPAATAPNVRFKLDYLMPTASFKDRGAVVLATLARRLGVAAAVLDSSGNAGAAAAAYLARAAVPCRIHVPAATSRAKLAQLRAHGAQVVAAGTRADAAAAARSAATEPGVFYASHVYQPYFLHGVKTYGYELWEQCGRRLPDTVVVPVGNGTLLLGCALAFGELLRSGLAERMPTLVAVQAARCAPIAAAYDAGSAEVAPAGAAETVAEGIAIADPPRGAQILAAIRRSAGAVVTVSDDEIVSARAELGAQGLFVEPTAAVCWAAVRRRAPVVPALRAADVVVPLCGAGLKHPD